MKVVLELQDQPSNVRRVTVRHDIVIGRGSDCNLRLSSPQVSRRHCFLRVGREGVSVTDLDSSNGTYVDSKRIKSGVRQELSNGSVLSLGPIKFVVRVSEDAVVADILKASVLKDSANSKASNAASDPSTIVSSASALITSPNAAAPRAMDMDVEQAGAASEAHDATADFDNGDESPVRAINRKFTPSSESMDSRAEIVELGRLIKERDSKSNIDPPLAGADADSDAAVSDAVVSDAVEEASFFNYDGADDTLPAPRSEHNDLVEDVVVIEDVVEIADVEVEEVVEVLDEVDADADVVGLADVELVEDAAEIVDVAEIVGVENIDDVEEVVEVLEESDEIASETGLPDWSAIPQNADGISADVSAIAAEQNSDAIFDEFASVKNDESLDAVDLVEDAEVVDVLEVVEVGDVVGVTADAELPHDDFAAIVDDSVDGDAVSEEVEAFVDEVALTLPVETPSEVEEFDFFDDAGVEVLDSELSADDVPKDGMVDGGRNATFFPAEMLNPEMPEVSGFGTVPAVEHFEGVFDDPELLSDVEAVSGPDDFPGSAWPIASSEESSIIDDASAISTNGVTDSEVDEEVVEEVAVIEELSEMGDAPAEVVAEVSDVAEPPENVENFDWLSEEEDVVEVAAIDEDVEAVQEIAVEEAEEIDVEMIADDIVEDVETIDAVNVVSENDNDGQLDWFGSNSDSSANDDDDIDPELKKFLKGF